MLKKVFDFLFKDYPIITKTVLIVIVVLSLLIVFRSPVYNLFSFIQSTFDVHSPEYNKMANENKKLKEEISQNTLLVEDLKDSLKVKDIQINELDIEKKSLQAIRSINIRQLKAAKGNIHKLDSIADKVL